MSTTTDDSGPPTITFEPDGTNITVTVAWQHRRVLLTVPRALTGPVSVSLAFPEDTNPS